MADAFRPDGKLNIPTQAAADYIAEQGQIMPRELSLQDRARGALAKLIGGDNYTRSDYVTAGNIVGNPDEGIAEGLGVADITPLGLVFGVDDAIRGFRKAEGATDYIAPTVGLGLSAVEALPATKILTKPLRSFLGNLSRKSGDITDPSRREFIAGAAATPVVAGALASLPMTETIRSAVQNVAPSIQPPDFKMLSGIFEGRTFRKSLDEEAQDVASQTGMDIEDIKKDIIDDIYEADFNNIADNVLMNISDESNQIDDFLSSSFPTTKAYVSEKGGLADSAPIIDELMEDYGLSKAEVKAYLKKEGILQVPSSGGRNIGSMEELISQLPSD